MKQRKYAFTLVELLVVIAIIALLISVLLPAVQSARAKANLVACGTSVRGICQAINNYAIEHKGAPPLTGIGAATFNSQYKNLGVGTTYGGKNLGTNNNPIIVNQIGANMVPDYLSPAMFVDAASPEKQGGFFSNNNWQAWYQILPIVGKCPATTGQIAAGWDSPAAVTSSGAYTTPFRYGKQLNLSKSTKAWVLDSTRSYASVLHFNSKTQVATFNLGFSDASVRTAGDADFYKGYKSAGGGTWQKAVDIIASLELNSLGQDYKLNGQCPWLTTAPQPPTGQWWKVEDNQMAISIN